jgi:hypothetical protein
MRHEIINILLYSRFTTFALVAKKFLFCAFSSSFFADLRELNSIGFYLLASSRTMNAVASADASVSARTSIAQS